MESAFTLFDEAAKTRVAEAIARSESKTSAEIVPVVVRRADNYVEVRERGAIGGVLLASAILLVSMSDPTVSNLLLAQAVGLVAGYLLAVIPLLGRWLVGRAVLDRSARDRAAQLFRELGLDRTRDRTGILICVSLFEREVVVLGDEAVHAQVGADGWEALVRKLTSRIREGKAVDGICEAIEQMGERLAPLFPRRDDDENELRDELHLR